MDKVHSIVLNKVIFAHSLVRWLASLLLLYTVFSVKDFESIQVQMRRDEKLAKIKTLYLNSFDIEICFA